MPDGTETEINIVLLRHGMTKANERHCYLGKGDESLSEYGKEKLRIRLAGGAYACVTQKKEIFLLTSPMRRCIETAKLLFPELTAYVIEEWKEIDFGQFEGKTYQELSGNPDYQAWIDSGGSLAFPQGESRECFMQRTAAGMERAARLIGECHSLEKGALVQQTVAVVHGGTIMALMSGWTGGDYFDFQVENGCGFQCVLEKKNGRFAAREWSRLE